MHAYNKVVLALGSNLGDKKINLLNTLNHIHNHIGFVTQTSAIYETPSWGFNSFPFYNICIFIHTHLTPEKLLVALKDVEIKMGRTKKSVLQYEARIVDIDIIYFNDFILNTGDLQIPHKEIQNRRFVLIPLNDLLFDWKHPILNKSTQEMLQVCEDTSEITFVENIELPKDDLSFQKIKFMAIEGNIGSGKTSLTEKIAQDFNAQPILERFADNAFLPKFYEDPLRYAFPLEMSFLADRYSQLNNALGQYNLFNDFVIADYYIYKSLIFAQVTLEPDEALLYRNIFEVLHKESTKPDLYIYLYQSTTNLLQNIKKRGRVYEENIQAAYLNNINKSYSEFIKTLPQENVLIIDVSSKDFVENHQDYIEILGLINDKISSVTNR